MFIKRMRLINVRNANVSTCDCEVSKFKVTKSRNGGHSTTSSHRIDFNQEKEEL